MPLLTRAEFDVHIGKGDAALVTSEPNSFETAEAAASETVVSITGITIPESVDDAPAWAKQPVAWLVYHALLNRLTSIPAEKIQMWEKRRQAAEEMLTRQAGRLTGTDDSGTSAATGKIDGMPTW